jgi:MFS family permease
MTTRSGATRTRVQGAALVGAFVGMLLSVVHLYALGAFVQPMESDLGWSRSQISFGFTALTVVVALLNPVAGAALDRFGSRRVASVGVPLYVLAFSLLPVATFTPAAWWACWGLLGVTSCLIGPAVWTRAVAGVFTKNRGLAVATALCGMSVSSFLVPLSANSLINRYGWRQSFVLLALAYGGVCFLTSFLLPSHARAQGADADGASTRREARELMVSAPFVRLTFGATTFSLISTAFITSAIPMLTSGGVTRDVAAAIAATMGITGVIGRLSSGFLIDRLEPRFVSAAAMMLPILAAILLLLAPGSAPVATVAMLLFGLALGAEFDTFAVMMSRLFDLKYFGILFATLVSGTAVAGALGPVGASLIYDMTGSYMLMLEGVIPVSLIAAALVLAVGPVAPVVEPLLAADGASS